MNADEQIPESFDQLAGSRRAWIEQVLRPWCQRASLNDLRKAELEWLDIAGKVDPESTLWTWAWERFPELVHPELPGVDETHQVEVMLADGSVLTGYPDQRQSTRGMLVLVNHAADQLNSLPPVAIDQIQSARRC